MARAYCGRVCLQHRDGDWRLDPEVGGGGEEHLLFDTGAMRAPAGLIGGPPIFARTVDPETRRTLGL
jgi:hypothetical protein